MERAFMSRVKFWITATCLSLAASDLAYAQVMYRRYPHPRYYYGYGPPIYAYPPPPVVVVPRYAYPPPASVTPPPVVAAPPPAYGYGVVGPRGHLGFGYATPGFGVFIGR
jgi:hypothetical protein